MSTIYFEAKLFKIKDWIILLLPQSASVKLPSRGMTMIKGTIKGFPFQTVLEPDGKGSHWFRVDKNLSKAAGVSVGETVKLAIETTDEWIEPEVPEDVRKAFLRDQEVYSLWKRITPNARWDWIRWIRAVKQPETRKKHIEVAYLKLKAGTRRPCCFNRSLCSEPYVSHNWILLNPIQSV